MEGGVPANDSLWLFSAFPGFISLPFSILFSLMHTCIPRECGFPTEPSYIPCTLRHHSAGPFAFATTP